MAAHPKFVTPQEYLTFERQSEEKHEYYDGEIFAMAGASDEHNTIAGNTFASLHAQIRKRPCKVYSGDMRVKTYSTTLYTYPDVTVVCDTPKFEDAEVDTLLNPNVIIEVLSPSTENYDRGKKFQHYRTLDSLQEYLLVSQESVRIEHYVRQGNQWILTDAASLDAALTLPSINCTLALADVYEKVTLEDELTKMATDPDIQRENKAINAEFAETESDGLTTDG
jgi:Uma2 family endonuclease